METTSKPDGALDLLGKAASAVSASSKTLELSQPVPFLQDKLQQVKAVYTSIPPGLDLSDAKQLQQTFPNVSTGRRPIPLCLLLDAPTASDQLTVINYWQGLSKQKQATAMEQLKHYYSNPMASNVRLNPNYIELYQLTKGFTTSLNHWTPSQAPPLPDTSKKRPPPSEQPEEEEDDEDTLPKFPLVPPLSQPIPCLGNKLQSVRAVYQELPPHVDWNNPKQLQQLFPCYNGGSRQIPLCLLLEAATDQDKLSVLNYWAGLSAAQQKEAVQALKDHFANPTVSNAPLPADYLYKKRVTKNFTIPFKKAKAMHETLPGLPPAPLPDYRFKAKRNGAAKHKPLGRTPCPGWRSTAKHDELFRQCLCCHVQESQLGMSSTTLPMVLNIHPSLSSSELRDQLKFYNEEGEYVLRSVQCQRTDYDGQSGLRCPNCKALSRVISNWKGKQKHSRKNAINNNNASEMDKHAKMRDKNKRLRVELNSAMKREKRLREKLCKPDETPRPVDWGEPATVFYHHHPM